MKILIGFVLGLLLVSCIYTGSIPPGYARDKPGIGVDLKQEKPKVAIACSKSEGTCIVTVEQAHQLAQLVDGMETTNNQLRLIIMKQVGEVNYLKSLYGRCAMEL
jgi:hypothetical protein